MGKNKLERFAETAEFPNFIQNPSHRPGDRHPYSSRWSQDFFGNGNPLVLEIGCGKGEYTTGLAGLHPEKNFIGIDVKGARMWRGAKTALEQNIRNAAFIRTQAGLLPGYFGNSEVSEIWFTFPDPFHKKAKANKRLTSQRYLNIFSAFLKPGAIIHLKTDNTPLFDYTLGVIEENGHSLIYHTRDLYGSSYKGVAAAIQTFYESMFLNQGMKINYLKFSLQQTSDEKI